MKVWTWIVIGMVVSSPCMADIPPWDGDANTTSVHYSFLTGAIPPVSDTETNPYGSVTPGLLVGALGSGWQDPTLPPEDNQLTRGDGTGAWDIGGLDGLLSFDVPFSDGSLSLYTLELVIDVIAYQSLPKLPTIEVSDSVLDHNIDIILEQPDTLGNWMRQSWVGTVEVASSSSVSIGLTGSSTGSLIDRVSIYTRVIPEPTAISLILLSSGFALVIKRRLS